MSKFRYDTQDLAVQVDVIRYHLRHLYSMNGPPPADLALDHDMLWPERESERLDNFAKLAETKAVAAREAEQRVKQESGDEKSPTYRAALTAAVTAEAVAKQARADADKAKATLDTTPAPDSRVQA